MPLRAWEYLPQRIPDQDGLDRIREIAHYMASDWSFHEIAIADPFSAESYVQRAGEMLQALVGWPQGYQISTWVEETDQT